MHDSSGIAEHCRASNRQLKTSNAHSSCHSTSPKTSPTKMATDTFAAATAIPRWPAGADKDYIQARNDLLKEEHDLRAHIERVAAMRRSLPAGAIMPSYECDEGPIDLSSDFPNKKTSLADLAADGRSVVLYHFMYDPTDTEPCGMCSMAAVWSSITRIVYGARRPDVHRMYFEDRHLGIGDFMEDAWRDDVRIRGGVLAAECASLLYGPGDHPPSAEQANV